MSVLLHITGPHIDRIAEAMREPGEGIPVPAKLAVDLRGIDGLVFALRAAADELERYEREHPIPAREEASP